MPKHFTEKNWSSLSQLNSFFNNQKGRGREKVLSFIGHTLETNKAIYKLDFDGLIVEEKKKNK
jgi:hypothetical protein